MRTASCWREEKAIEEIGSNEMDISNPATRGRTMSDADQALVRAIPSTELKDVLATVIFSRYPLAQRSVNRKRILPQALRSLYLENPAPYEAPHPKSGQSHSQRKRLLSFLNSIKVRGGGNDVLLFLSIIEAKYTVEPGAPVTLRDLVAAWRSPALDAARAHYYFPDGYGEGKREFLDEMFSIFEEFYHGELEKDIFDTEYMNSMAPSRGEVGPWELFRSMERKLISRAELLMRAPSLASATTGKLGLPHYLEHPALRPHGDRIIGLYKGMIGERWELDVVEQMAAVAPRGFTLGQLISFLLLMEEYNVEWAIAAFEWENPMVSEERIMEQLSNLQLGE